jgi:hypothetical protein
MARYHIVVALLKVLGVYCGFMGMATLAHALWIARIWSLSRQPGLDDQRASVLIMPTAYLLVSPVLIFAAPLIAQLCGEWKPQA